MELKERFLKYVAINTRSDENSDTFPSTAAEWDLLNLLVEEMKLLGLEDVTIDKYGYAMGTIPATKGKEGAPVIGFLAHVDTSPDMSGENVRPRIIESYDGEDIVLNNTLTMKVAEFPELQKFIGHTLIHTDGTTLLGADDKAGVAEIMTAAEYLMAHPEIEHGKIRIGFTPDEEIGRGVDFFDVKAFGADFAYTMDGGYEGELEYENFNAAGCKVKVHGVNVHPGYGYHKMINSMRIANHFAMMLPRWETPEHTQGYEGFYHLIAMNGSVEETTLQYIIRDHDRARFESRKREIEHLARKINQEYGEGTIEVEIRDQYYNMREKIDPDNMHVVNLAIEAMQAVGVACKVKPIRGGTDGARLSFMGLPCPTIFGGGMNFHGKFEYCSLNSMEKAVKVIINLAKIWAK